MDNRSAENMAVVIEEKGSDDQDGGDHVTKEGYEGETNDLYANQEGTK